MDQLQELERVEKARPSTERRIPMTYADFLKNFDDSTHAEWANGEAIVFMPPTIKHQDIVVFLVGLIDGFVKVFRLGKALTAPCEMRLALTDTSREPDVMFLATANFERLSENRINGPADLVIEVISTESVSRDRSDKFYEYQANGVREYWVIDPRPGVERADFWVLGEDGRYSPVLIESNGIYHSTVLPNFKLNVSSLLSDETLDHVQSLIDMIGIEVMSRRRQQKG